MRSELLEVLLVLAMKLSYKVKGPLYGNRLIQNGYLEFPA